MFFVYILQSLKNHSYYVGSSKNILKRLDLHNSGIVKSTKRYIPWKLVYREQYQTLKRARVREKQIKSWKKRGAIENVIHRGSSITLVGP